MAVGAIARRLPASRLALLLAGRRARAALARARADVQGVPLPDAVATRARTPVAARKRPRTLRFVARAVAAVLASEGETHPCLPRALALFEEARLLGFDPRVVVGVRRGASGVESHAWLTLDGKPFLEAHETPDRYETIAILP